MGGVSVGERSLKIDMLGIRYKVTLIELIQVRGTIIVQGFKEENHSQRKSLEKMLET